MILSSVLTDNDRHFPRDWLARRGIDLVAAGELLSQIAHSNAEALFWAHRVAVANSPKSEDAILETLAKAVGEPAAESVRRVVTSGSFQDASEVLRDGPPLGEAHEDPVAGKGAALEAAVRTGWDDIARGRSTDVEDEDMDDDIAGLGGSGDGPAVSA